MTEIEVPFKPTRYITQSYTSTQTLYTHIQELDLALSDTYTLHQIAEAINVDSYTTTETVYTHNNLTHQMLSTTYDASDTVKNDFNLTKTAINVDSYSAARNAYTDLQWLRLATGAEFDGSPDIYDVLVTGFDSSSLTPSATGSALEVAQHILDYVDGSIAEPATYTRQIGVCQITTYDFDINQAAGTYDLFTATTAPVVLEAFMTLSLDDHSGKGTYTGISVQTDELTNQVVIPQGSGVAANLTSYAQLAWDGFVHLRTGSKLQYTVYGGAIGSASPMTCTAKYRAVTNGGYLDTP